MTPEQKTYLDYLFKKAWTPKEEIEAHQWCEKYVTKIPYSPKPGPYSSEGSPMHVDIMRAFMDISVRLVSVLAPVQCAKTLCMELMLEWLIVNDPGPAMYLHQSDYYAKDHMKNRLIPLFENTIGVKELLPPIHKRKLDSIQFTNSMPLWVLGAVKKNLQSRSIRYLKCDEWWMYTLDGIIDQALKRMTAFAWNSKAYLVSQGGDEGQEGHRIHNETDCREQHITCPDCGETYPWTFEQLGGYKEGQCDKDGKPKLSWEFCKRKDGSYDYNQIYSSTVFMCPYCYKIHEDSDYNRKKLLKNTSFIATNPKSQDGQIGFHYESNGFVKWGQLGVEYFKGRDLMKRGVDTLLKQFRQQRRALPWSESLDDFQVNLSTSSYKTGEQWKLEAALRTVLVRNKPVTKVVPGPVEIDENMCRLRAMFIDVQLDHFWVLVLSISATGRVRIFRFCGGKGEHGVEEWEDLERIQKECEVPDSLVFVDAGYKTYTIYKQCYLRGWTGLMGSDRDEWERRTVKSGTTKVSKRCYSKNLRPEIDGKYVANAFSWSNLIIKDMVVANLDNGNIELPADSTKLLLTQLDSEEKVDQVKKHGKIVKLKKPRYEQIGKRPNHYWDCLCMGMVLIVMLGLIGNESLLDEKKQ